MVGVVCSCTDGSTPFLVWLTVVHICRVLLISSPEGSGEIHSLSGFVKPDCHHSSSAQTLNSSFLNRQPFTPPLSFSSCSTVIYQNRPGRFTHPSAFIIVVASIAAATPRTVQPLTFILTHFRNATLKPSGTLSLPTPNNTTEEIGTNGRFSSWVEAARMAYSWAKRSAVRKVERRVEVDGKEGRMLFTTVSFECI